jgi:uncharacterized protein
MNTMLELEDFLKLDEDKIDLNRKISSLIDHISNLISDGVIIAFSGGVDSTFLLWISEKIRIVNGGKLIALTTNSASMPEKDLSDAVNFAKSLNVEHKILHSNEIEINEYSTNNQDRCYYCKTELFRITKEIAQKNSCKHILYGFNFSDINDTRPGHKAALENDIISPLANAELTKDDLRYIMELNELPFYDKPSSPCLSSRIMHGIEVTEERLQHVQEMENILYKNGIKIFRVRISKNDNKNFLRIEVSPDEMEKVIKLNNILVEEGLKRGYRWVTLDLQGYRTGGGSV